jgi:hypothetical protein
VGNIFIPLYNLVGYSVEVATMRVILVVAIFFFISFICIFSI